MRRLLFFLSILLFVIPPVNGLEYNKQGEPVFSIENKTLIKSTDFCFEYDDKRLCRQVADFKQEILGVTCDYNLLLLLSNEVISYRFSCELAVPQKICPLVLNLGVWPLKIFNDEFEVNLTNAPIVIGRSPFVLSGNNRSLYFPISEGYTYSLFESNNGYTLNICSQNSTNIYGSKVEIVAISTELNKTDFHKNPSVSAYETPPKVLSYGSEETQASIVIADFFTGRLSRWNPALPYAEVALEISPKNETYDKNETLNFTFKSLAGTVTERVSYNSGRKKWIFPESGTIQLDFNYVPWFFPTSKYSSEIIIENNISLNGNQTLKVPTSEFLSAYVIFDGSKIKLEVYYNWLTFLVLGIGLVLFFGTLLYCFKKVYSGIRVPSFAYFIQLAPAISLYVGLIPLRSILFFVLVSSIIFFWIYFGYTKYKINAKVKQNKNERRGRH